MLQALQKPQRDFEHTTSSSLPPQGSRLVRESRTDVCSNVSRCELLLVKGQSSSQACCIVSSWETPPLSFQVSLCKWQETCRCQNPSFSSLTTEILHKMKSGNPDAIKPSRENVGQYLLTSLSLHIDGMWLLSTEVCKLNWDAVCCEVMLEPVISWRRSTSVVFGTQKNWKGRSFL